MRRDRGGAAAPTDELAHAPASDAGVRRGSRRVGVGRGRGRCSSSVLARVEHRDDTRSDSGDERRARAETRRRVAPEQSTGAATPATSDRRCVDEPHRRVRRRGAAGASHFGVVPRLE